MNNMDVLKGTLLAGALAYSAFANSESNGIFRNGYEEPGYCPAGRITHTTVSWRYDGIGRRLVDVTKADEIWGRHTASAPTVPYPWMNYFAVFWQLPRNGYVSAQFTIPPWVPTWQWSKMTHGETLPGPETDIAYSDWCGDFNPPEPHCATFGTRTGQGLGTYKLPDAPVLTACNLNPGGTYYVNFRFTDPNAVDLTYCGTSWCRTTVNNNHTP